MKNWKTVSAQLGIIALTAVLCAASSSTARAQSAPTPLASAAQSRPLDDTPAGSTVAVTREQYVKTSPKSSVSQGATISQRTTQPRKGVHVSTFRAVMLFVTVALFAM